MKSARCAGALALATAALLLGACSAGGGQAAPASAQSPWLAVARGTVDVEGGMIEVAARTAGVVESVAVTRGDAVKRGAVLATLDPRAATIAVASARAGEAQARAQLDELDVSLRQAAQQAPRAAEAAKMGAATVESAEQARDLVATLKAKRAAAQAALDAATQQVAAAQLGLDATRLRAPVAGTVVARNVTVGRSVSATSGQALFELLPDRPHIVRAQLNVEAAGVIHPGTRAQVVGESGSGPTYAAKVTWVGQVLQAASLTPDPLERALANDVDCTLELEPPKAGTPPLRIGQRVLVRFPKR